MPEGLHTGRKVRFQLLFNENYHKGDEHSIPVVGTVVGINEPHRWFSVAYGGNQRTSFNFSQIGQAVKFVG